MAIVPGALSGSLDFNQSGNVGSCNFFHQGEMDEVRFSNNVRYTGNFTVPPAAFTTDANTIALYHLDGCVSGLVPDASAHANNASPKNLTGSCTFTLPSPPAIPANGAAGNVSKAEYFFDTDPGFGSGINIPVTAAADIAASPSLNIAGLGNGAHNIYVRTRDAAGHWGTTNNSAFFIVPPIANIPASGAAAQIVKAEYFYDTDPGFGSGTNIPITGSFDVSGVFPVNTASLGTGVHYIYLRTKDAAGRWSITNVSSFYVLSAGFTMPANAAPANIVKAEYFLDNDPGFGSGTNIPVTAGMDVTASNVFVNLNGLSDGVHHLFLRTKDAAGKWSITNQNVFSIIAASITIPSNPAAGNITKLEYFFDTDPGFGNGTIVSVTPTTNLTSFALAANVSALADGTHTLYIRTYDDWGITNTRNFNKGAVVPLTWLSFNAKAMADSVLLDWVTANEVNTNHFDVERSTDRLSFKKLGTVAAASSGAATHAYNFTDLHPEAGINYYRIKQIDNDGRFNYSAVIPIRFGKATDAITIFPNPAKDVLNILFDHLQEKNTVLQLVSNNGQVLQTVSVENVLSKQLNVSSLASGSYQLRITNSQGTVTKTVLIK